MAKSIKDLRQEKGYRSAREFADALGIATSSMSRYDKDPESMPLKHAWAMADLLGCSIDEVVGREPVTAGRNDLQEFYDGLLPETRALLDEFMEFAAAKDKAIRDRAQASEEARYDRLCQFHERMFHQAVYDSAEFGEVVVFDTPADERAAFLLFLRDKAAEKRRPGIDLHCEVLEEELRGDYIDADGTERHWSEDEIQQMLEDERTQIDNEYAKKNEEVIAKTMQAYDRLHAPQSLGFGPKATVEYTAVRLP